MAADDSQSWERAKTEYEAGLQQFRLMSTLRRQDMAFVTTVQAAVLTIIGPKLLSLGFSGFLLSAIAFFVLLLGLNSERRLSAYMAGYMTRVKTIETAYGMSMFSDESNGIRKAWLLMSNARVFPIYYSIFIFAWLVTWLWNLRNRQ